jgi:hypothetical protein
VWPFRRHRAEGPATPPDGAQVPAASLAAAFGGELRGGWAGLPPLRPGVTATETTFRTRDLQRLLGSWSSPAAMGQMGHDRGGSAAGLVAGLVEPIGSAGSIGPAVAPVGPELVVRHPGAAARPPGNGRFDLVELAGAAPAQADPVSGGDGLGAPDPVAMPSPGVAPSSAVAQPSRALTLARTPATPRRHLPVVDARPSGADPSGGAVPPGVAAPTGVRDAAPAEVPQRSEPSRPEPGARTLRVDREAADPLPSPATRRRPGLGAPLRADSLPPKPRRPESVRPDGEPAVLGVDGGPGFTTVDLAVLHRERAGDATRPADGRTGTRADESTPLDQPLSAHLPDAAGAGSRAPLLGRSDDHDEPAGPAGGPQAAAVAGGRAADSPVPGETGPPALAPAPLLPVSRLRPRSVEPAPPTAVPGSADVASSASRGASTTGPLQRDGVATHRPPAGWPDGGGVAPARTLPQAAPPVLAALPRPAATVGAPAGAGAPTPRLSPPALPLQRSPAVPGMAAATTTAGWDDRQVGPPAPSGPPGAVLAGSQQAGPAPARSGSVQRLPDTAPPASAESPSAAAPPAAGPAPVAAAAAAAPAAPSSMSRSDLDLLARELFDPLCYLLRAELRVGRERAGSLLDL